MNEVDKSLLNYLFEYEDGRLFWKIKPSQNTNVGDEAGFLRSEGYYGISIKDKTYKRSKLIWIYHYGVIPEGMTIDHIDGIRDNDKVSNLRLATHTENCRNKGKQKRNTSGFKGVTTRKYGFEAAFKIDGVNHYLGTFKTAEEAYKAYCEAVTKAHGIFFKG